MDPGKLGGAIDSLGPVIDSDAALANSIKCEEIHENTFVVMS